MADRMRVTSFIGSTEKLKRRRVSSAPCPGGDSGNVYNSVDVGPGEPADPFPQLNGDYTPQVATSPEHLRHSARRPVAGSPLPRCPGHPVRGGKYGATRSLLPLVVRSCLRAPIRNTGALSSEGYSGLPGGSWLLSNSDRDEFEDSLPAEVAEVVRRAARFPPRHQGVAGDVAHAHPAQALVQQCGLAAGDGVQNQQRLAAFTRRSF